MNVSLLRFHNCEAYPVAYPDMILANQRAALALRPQEMRLKVLILGAFLARWCSIRKAKI